jgi:hypothetical protein
MMQIKVTTKYLTDASFSQEVTLEEHKKVLLTVMKFIVDTRDKQLREALIGLGWQPPRET